MLPGKKPVCVAEAVDARASADRIVRSFMVF